MNKGLSQFLQDYKFFRIKKSKSILFTILDEKKGKIYQKSKEAFIEEVYNLALVYNTDNSHIITEVKSRVDYVDNRYTNATLLFNYLLENNGIKLVEDITFKPIPKRLIEEKDGIYLNEYTPTKYLNPKFNNGCKDENSFSHITLLLLNLCANDKEALKYLLKVLSHSIKFPHIKRHGFLTIQGEGAGGKGTFFDLVMKPIFDDYLIVDTEEILRTNFNEYSYKCIWVIIEEKEDTRHKGSLGSIIKYVTGNSKGVSEAKGRDRKIVNDYRNFAITTNETNPGLDLKGHDRRATILGYSRALGGHKSKSPQIRKVLENEIPKELDNFVSYLKNLEFDTEEIFNAYENNARKNVLELDMNNVELFIEEIKSYKGSLLNHILNDYEIEFSKLYFITRDNETYIWFKDIYNLFIAYCRKNERMITKDNKFSQDFNNVTGLETKRIKDKNKESKFYRIKDFLEKFELKIDYNFIETQNGNKTFSSNEIESITTNLTEDII